MRAACGSVSTNLAMRGHAARRQGVAGVCREGGVAIGTAGPYAQVRGGRCLCGGLRTDGAGFAEGGWGVMLFRP